MAQAFRTLIVAFMLVGLLAGCGAAGTPDGAGADATTGSTAASASTANPAASADASTVGSAAASVAAATTTPTTAETSAAGTTAAHISGTSVVGIELPEVDAAEVTGDIVTSGSSTVFPLMQRMAERFKDEGYGGTISVDEVGTGAGFQRFCEAGETDIANASRPIKDEEAQKCAALSPARTPIEFRVGTDALAIVVSSQNTFLDALTLEQLGQIYTGEVKTWNQLDPSYPNEPIELYSPGTDSGTYDYFVEEVLDKDEAKVKALQGLNPTQSENDNVLVQGIESSPNAIGYFGYAYYQENTDRLKILQIDGVEPTEETAESGEYPLARPLFIYSDAAILQAKPHVAAFINFFLSNVNDEIIDVGYFPASAEALNTAKQSWQAANGQ